MAKSDTWAAMRQIVLDRDGPKCYYCRVPTAATIEHLRAREDLGEHRIHNLVLACPYCNSSRGDTPLEQWYETRGWELPLPEGLGSDLDAMLKKFYPNIERRGRYVFTRSTNSRIRVENSKATLEIRAAKGYNWNFIELGPVNQIRTVAAIYDFIRRHGTKPVKIKSK